MGGVIEAVARNVPAGLGAPVFDKLEADLAKGCMSLPAAKGFEVTYGCCLNPTNRCLFQVGSGFSGTLLTGFQHNDEFFVDENDCIR